MTTRVDPTSLRFAAQADLVALTAEMLRSPQTVASQAAAPWFTEPVTSYLSLFDLAFASNAIGNVPSQPAGPPAVSSNELSTLRELFTELHNAAVQLRHEDWSDEYWRLFDGAQACPLNQASYIRRDKGTILGDLAGFYRAFGWQHNVANGERPDHLLSQLEFAGMLLAMAATAADDQQHDVVNEALGQFHRVHMFDWLPSVCNQMHTATSLSYFELVSRWLWALWETLSRVNAWPSDQQAQSILSPNLDPEDPYECGAPDLVTLQATVSPKCRE